jgi:hypothetical protein
VISRISDAYGLRLLAVPRVRWVALGIVVGILLLFRLIQFVSIFTGEKGAFDFGAYWLAAGRVLQGNPLYSVQQLAGPYSTEAQDVFRYPPVFAVAALPFRALFPDDYRVAGLAWAAFEVLVMATSFAVVAATRRRAHVLAVSGQYRLPVLIAVGLGFTPVIGDLAVGNVNVVLLGLLTLCWAGVSMQSSGGRRLAGIALGVAVVVKVFPIVLIVWLVLRREWAATRWTISTALVLALASVPFTGPQAWLDYPAVLINMRGTTGYPEAIAPAGMLAPILGSTLAQAIVSTAAVALVVYAGRTLSLQRGFAVAVVGAVMITPSLWQHYLAVLVLPLLIGYASGVPVPALVLSFVLMSSGYPPWAGTFAPMLYRIELLLGVAILLGVLLSPGRRFRVVPSRDEEFLDGAGRQGGLGRGEQPEERPAPAG